MRRGRNAFFLLLLLSNAGFPARASEVSCSSPGALAVSFCLRSLLQVHCALLSGAAPPILGDCLTAAARAVTTLDLEVLPLPKGSRGLPVLAFSKALEPLVLAPATARFLDALSADFEDSHRFEQPHSLWESSARFSSSEDLRLEMLGTLFQSVTPVTGGDIHFHLLKLARLARMYRFSRSHAARGARMERMRVRIQEQIEAFHDGKIQGDFNPDFVLYPPVPGAKDLDPALHHYYVPALLARRLLRSGERPGMAFFLPFLFNGLYELRKIDRKLKLGRWPWRHPLAIRGVEEQERVEMNVRKIYTGYAGALLGVGMTRSTMSWTRFRTEFFADPEGLIRRLLRASRSFP